MATAKRPFPKAATIFVVIGLITVAAIFTSSFVLAFHATTSVNNTEEAKELADQYVSKLNPDLRVKEIMEFSNQFYIMVQENSTGVSAFELLIDRNTGKTTYEPGPNMMWNTKYGHMQTGNPSASMPINATQASEIAQTWLDRNVSGAKVNEPDTFYGYYTIDFSESGQIFGMLSVNGYTGAVWYHTWHGSFISIVEYP